MTDQLAAVIEEILDTHILDHENSGLLEDITAAVRAHLTSDAVVERVARASRKAATNFNQWDDLMPQMRETWRAHARAALAAAAPPADGGSR